MGKMNGVVGIYRGCVRGGSPETDGRAAAEIVAPDALIRFWNLRGPGLCTGPESRVGAACGNG